MLPGACTAPTPFSMVTVSALALVQESVLVPPTTMPDGIALDVALEDAP